MEVNISEVATSIHAVNSEELLSPRLMNCIITQVVRALDERQEYRERIKQERCPTGGSEELERGGRY